ncbi:TonB-dependent receptor family protein [Methylophaga lonarensis]|uniref:TonB-dependent receptor family protein n=1 Tax=Methylophaga lonarensis TaxID=999151 RepID=UPI003D283DE0
MKPTPKLLSTIILTSLMGSSAIGLADETVSSEDIAGSPLDVGVMTVVGVLPDNLESVSGSYQIIDSEYLEDRRPLSIKETLHTVPGLNVVPDGSMSFDLNLGIRGLNPRRSAKAMIMEDGMPLQLAPYVDPVNHFAPHPAIIDRVEVIKGAGQILHGPQTLGGAVNFITRPVPRNGEVEGSVTSSFGNQSYRFLHGNVGWGNDIGGIMLDATQRRGDGIFRGAEYDIKEYRIKGELDITDRQTVMMKYTYTDDDRNQTEDYLTRDEYAQNKFRHRTAKFDRFEQERHSVQLKHLFDVNDQFRLTSQAYYNDIFRQGTRYSRAGNVVDDGNGNLVSTYQSCNGLRRQVALTDEDPANCGARLAPRQYYTWGAETRADFAHNLFGLENETIAGLRYHEDTAVRKESWARTRAEVRDFNAAYEENLFGRNSHWTLRARAISYYAQNTTFVGDWAITPGFRVERLRSSFDDNLNNTRTSRSQTEFLPSFGVAWSGIDNTTVFAGVHKGLSPARANRESIGVSAKPEKSTMYELGLRSNYLTGVYFEATLFHARNKDTLADDDGDFFNIGKSERTGIEIASRINFGDIMGTANNFYISGAWTHVPYAKYKDDAFDIDGDPITNRGNRLEYAPRNLVNLDFGYEHISGVDARIGLQHVGKQMPDSLNRREEDATGRRGIIPSYTVWNATVNYRVPNSGVTLFASVENLFDKEYLVSRNSGKLPGRERLFLGGITYDF